MKKLGIKNITQIMNYLYSINKPFELEQTMFTKKIIPLDANYYYSFMDNSSGIKPNELGFIGLVKKHCEKINFPLIVDRTVINYIKPSFTDPVYKLKGGYEIDLTGAYWEFCYKEGCLTENLYKRGLEVRKKVRLIALGNLAKRLARLRYDGFKYLPIVFESSYKTENIFFHVSQLTDLLMSKLIVLAERDFLFYWCDAIFVKTPQARARIENYLISENIKYKALELIKVHRQQSKIEVWDEKHKTETNPEGRRVFNFKKNNLLIGLLNKPKNG